jgi:hypothetical protein
VFGTGRRRAETEPLERSLSGREGDSCAYELLVWKVRERSEVFIQFMAPKKSRADETMRRSPAKSYTISSSEASRQNSLVLCSCVHNRLTSSSITGSGIDRLVHDVGTLFSVEDFESFTILHRPIVDKDAL